MEPDHRHCRQDSLGEEDKAFDVPLGGVTVGTVTLKVIFVVDKVEMHALIDVFHNAYVYVLHVSAVVHVEVADIAELTPVFPRDAGIVGDDNTDVILAAVQTLGQCADYVCQTAGLNERDAFRGSKQNIFHDPIYCAEKRHILLSYVSQKAYLFAALSICSVCAAAVPPMHSFFLLLYYTLFRAVRQGISQKMRKHFHKKLS